MQHKETLLTLTLTSHDPINTSKNKQVILEEYQPHMSILTESVKVKFAIKPAKTDSLSPTVVT